jgi:sulfate adenylyltransferase
MSLAVEGLVIFFTGYSGSGKTTLASLLSGKLMTLYHRKTTMLDGDIIRSFLCSKLGFSKDDRCLNIERIGYVASEVAKHGGIAVCAAIAPYDESRKLIRQMVKEKGGKFVLIYLSTPVSICSERDPKGLYKKARRGEIKNFTGISDPYEPPEDAELVINTETANEKDSTNRILMYLDPEYGT